MPLPLIAVGISAGVGIYQAIQGGKTAKKAQEAINSYQRQDLTNYADNLSVRTEAQQFQAQQADQTLANSLDFLQQGGSYQNVNTITNQALKSKQKIAAGIQSQRNRIDDLRLQENTRIREIQESRENADLEGLGAQLQYGNQQQAQGISAVGAGFNQLAQLGITQGFGGGGRGGVASTVDSAVTPQSISNATVRGQGAYQSPLTTQQRFNPLPIYGGNRTSSQNTRNA